MLCVSHESVHTARFIGIKLSLWCPLALEFEVISKEIETSLFQCLSVRGALRRGHDDIFIRCSKVRYRIPALPGSSAAAPKFKSSGMEG